MHPFPVYWERMHGFQSPREIITWSLSFRCCLAQNFTLRDIMWLIIDCSQVCLQLPNKNVMIINFALIYANLLCSCLGDDNTRTELHHSRVNHQDYHSELDIARFLYHHIISIYVKFRASEFSWSWQLLKMLQNIVKAPKTYKWAK